MRTQQIIERLYCIRRQSDNQCRTENNIDALIYELENERATQIPYRVEIVIRGMRPDVAREAIATRLRKFDQHIRVDPVDPMHVLTGRRYKYTTLIHTALELPDPRIDDIMNEDFMIFEHIA